MKQRGIDDSYCQKMIIDYLKKFRKASREDFDKLLTDKLGDILTAEQKRNKITNNLQFLRRQEIIKVSDKRSWILYENS
jgi:ATP-dependent DNA helicase RecG